MLALTLALALALDPTTPPQTPRPPLRIEQGNKVLEDVDPASTELREQLRRYQSTRGAGLAGWLDKGCLLISTRFAETAQLHRVCAPNGAREQLTFYDEPIGAAVPFVRDGKRYVIFSKDIGGNENAQLHEMNLQTRGIRMLTDGKSRNGSPTLSKDGRQLAFSSNRRNGKDTDIYLLDLTREQAPPRLLVGEGGSWSAQDISFDGKMLAVSRYHSIEHTEPAIVDLKTGKLQMLPMEGKASMGGFVFDRSNRGAYYITDEPLNGKPSEFRTLRHHNEITGKITALSQSIPWDAQGLTLSDDGKLLAYQTNEGGVDRLHLLDTVTGRAIKAPQLPTGLIGGTAFSPDGRKLAIAIGGAATPSDVYVADIRSGQLTRWTHSEVGGLDTSRFITPTLIEYPTFDTVNGKPRLIPAWYYRPTCAGANAKVPVLINIHGGPESQSRPGFSSIAQFLAAERCVAMILPNVRGSSGYGRNYLGLDNGPLREDSVKDIGALLDWIAKQPELDSKRVGVMGGSYGGYMVLASLVHYGDRIRAAYDAVGISNFKTFLENTESYRRDQRRAEYGDERDPEMAKVFERISPLNHADRIQTPLFVSQGFNDPRVPYTEAEQIVKAVRANGIPVSYALYKDEGHGNRKKANVDFNTEAMMTFFDYYLFNPR